MLKQAVFLVGGLGTRLGQLTANTPKPFITVGGRPFIFYLIDNAVRHGLTDIILLAGYRGDVIENALGEGSEAAASYGREGVRIRIVTEPEAAGTGGALLYAKELLDEQFLLMNGDSFFDFNWLDFLTIDAPSNTLGSIALRKVPDGSRYGRVSVDGERIAAFEERGDAGETLINGGVYLLDRRILDHIDRKPMSIERDVFPRLAAAGQLYGRAYERFFIDIGIPADLERADATMLAATTRPAAFLDRDGVLNVDHGYVHKPEQFNWILGAKATIKSLNDAGYLVFVVTNQAGVAHGYYEEAEIHALHRWIKAHLQPLGAHIDQFEYCPHHPGGKVARYTRDCDRRKPGPGMLKACLARWPVDINRSFLIGDKQSDLDAAKAVGIKSYLFEGDDLLALAAKARNSV